MLKKKIVLITGVGKGIGLSCLKLCIKNHAFVIGVTRSKKDYNDLNKAYKDKCKMRADSHERSARGFKGPYPTPSESLRCELCIGIDTN